MHLKKRADPRPLPPTPYVLSPSGSFDGNDGKWSTFSINIGNDGSGNGQNFRVLISTSSPITLVPQQSEWCDEECAKSRGILLFDGQQPLGLVQSPSWKTAGLYDIPLPYWWSNSLTAITNNSTANTNGTNGTLGGVWGSENLGLGESTPQSPVLTEQYVAEYTFEDFFLGSLGLAVGSVGPPGGSKPNFLDNFYGSANMIASRSFGYTAGAYYRNNGEGVLGSLVLGGYDKSRLTGQGVSIPMPSDLNNTLAVGVQSILYEPNQNVEANTLSFTDTAGGFEASIDSTLPYLILPDDICDQFQQRFQLQFDQNTRLYTVNASAHDWNTQQNATVSFKIGTRPQDSATFATIVLPYAAFDQQVSFPITNEATKYFPIKKSDNGIYVLGRTFLQEAYIVVDYERANFTVAPAFYSQPLPDESLVTIFNKTYVGIPQNDSKTGLTTGAIVGVVVGIVLAFLVAGVGAFFWWRKRRDAKKKALQQQEKPLEVETATASNDVKYRRVSELTGSEPPYSPKTSTTGYYTNDPKAFPPISEMSPESTPAELYSPPPGSASERDSTDYFVAGMPRRRGATRNSSGQNTPSTPIAELPGDEGTHHVADQKSDALSPPQSLLHTRGSSDTSLPANIDEVLAGKQETKPEANAEEPQSTVQSGEAATADEAAKAKAEAKINDAELEDHFTSERRPSHARGLSDTTIQSDSTAVSQPTPDELERWARSGDADEEPRRPLSQ